MFAIDSELTLTLWILRHRSMSDRTAQHRPADLIMPVFLLYIYVVLYCIYCWLNFCEQFCEKLITCVQRLCDAKSKFRIVAICNFLDKRNVCFVGMFIVVINTKVLISVSTLSVAAATNVNSEESMSCRYLDSLHSTIILTRWKKNVYFPKSNATLHFGTLK